MKELYALCLLTLAAVFLDIVFIHSSTVTAQAPSRATPLPGKVAIQAVYPRSDGKDSQIDVTGAVVGFSCIAGGNATCFVATSR
jgi:hypothetical protein